MSNTNPTTESPTPDPKIENQNSKIENPITPHSLLLSLTQNPHASILELCEEFHCSVDDLIAVLDAPDFLKRFKLKTRLAFIQSRLAAANHLPHALNEMIVVLHKSEKPEVRRRAAASVIQMAGVPIRTCAQDAPDPLPEPPPPAAQHFDPDNVKDLDRILRALAYNPEIRNSQGMHLENLLTEHRHDFIDTLRSFYNTHR